MISILYWFVNLISNIAFFLIFGIFLNFKMNKKKKIIVITTLSVFCITIVYLFEEAVLHSYGLFMGILIKESVYFIISLVFCCLCFDNKASVKIHIPIFVISLQTIFKLLYFFIAILIIRADINHLFINNIEYRSIFILITDFSCLLLIYIINLIKKGMNFFILLFPLTLYLILFVPFGTASNEHIVEWTMHYLLLIIIAIIITTTALITVLNKITRNHELKNQNIILQKEQEMYKRQITEAGHYIEEIAKIKHNMKNQVFCVSELISNGNIDEAIRLCHDLTEKLNNTQYIFNTANIYLNAILNVIYKKSKERNIDIKAVIKTDLQYIDGTDLISLLGNICDNAIEALSKEKDNRELIIVLFEKADNYMISVKNYIESSVLTNNKNLKTSKKDPIFHGFGLKSVKNIVNKYGGILDLSEEDHMFIVNIMIKIPRNMK